MLINSNRHINTQTFWRKKFYCEYFTVGIRHLAISRDQWHKYHHNDVLIQVSWVGLHGPLYPWGILRSHIFYQKVIFLLETNNDTDFPKWMKLILHKYGSSTFCTLYWLNLYVLANQSWACNSTFNCQLENLKYWKKNAVWSQTDMNLNTSFITLLDLQH